MSSIPQIHGLKVFDNPTSCIADFENMHWTKKAVSFIQSFGTLFMYGFTKMGLIVNSVDLQMDPLTRLSLEDGSKKRLIICIHGLNNNPTQFKSIVAEMQKKDLSGACIFIPRILQKGNAKLDEMAQPIFKEIKEWAENSYDKELVLVGISNGGRIARAIEAEIAKSENSANIKKMHFVSIVGACKGSSLVNLVNKLGLSWLLSKNISEEMPKGSSRNQQLDRDWAAGISGGPEREYTFIASPHDWQVTNYDSSLMAVGQERARYAIVRGHGHNSIVNAVAQAVAEVVLE